MNHTNQAMNVLAVLAQVYPGIILDEPVDCAALVGDLTNLILRKENKHLRFALAMLITPEGDFPFPKNPRVRKATTQ